MTNRGELFAAVLADPDDDAPRLVLADWLTERGDPLGELIQLDCACRRLPRGSAERRAAAERRARLFVAHGVEDCSRAHAAGATRMWLSRGFIERALGSHIDGDGLLEAAPLVREIILTDDPSAAPWTILGPLRDKLTRYTSLNGTPPEDLEDGMFPRLIELSGKPTSSLVRAVLERAPALARVTVSPGSERDGEELGALLARREIEHLSLGGRTSGCRAALASLSSSYSLVSLDLANADGDLEVPDEIWSRLTELTLDAVEDTHPAFDERRTPKLQKITLRRPTTGMSEIRPGLLLVTHREIEASPLRVFIDDDPDLDDVYRALRVDVQAAELIQGDREVSVRDARVALADRGLSLAAIERDFGERWAWELDPDVAIGTRDLLVCTRSPEGS